MQVNSVEKLFEERNHNVRHPCAQAHMGYSMHDKNNGRDERLAALSYRRASVNRLASWQHWVVAQDVVQVSRDYRAG